MVAGAVVRRARPTVPLPLAAAIGLGLRPAPRDDGTNDEGHTAPDPSPAVAPPSAAVCP